VRFPVGFMGSRLLTASMEQLRAAIDCYYSAVAARPDYDDALFNLALLLTRSEQYQTALPIWDRFLELKPGGKDAQDARRFALLCRMSLTDGTVMRPGVK
jgi:tetratricopeptide (TPR) repeat protein